MRTETKRRPHRRDPMAGAKIVVDVLVWSLAAPIAFVLRLEENLGEYLPGLVAYTALGVGLKTLAVVSLGLQLRPWRWVSVRDLFRLSVAVVSVALVLTVGVSLWNVLGPEDLGVPRSIPLIEGAVALLALGAARVSRRLRHERFRRAEAGGDLRRVLIVGAGEAGAQLARELLRHPEAGIKPVGFLDDDPLKARRHVHGLPVLGALDELPEVVEEKRIVEVLMAMPSAPVRVVRRVLEAAREADVPSRTVPLLADLAAGNVRISQVRDIDLDDLLGRDPVRLDDGPIQAYVAGRRVLVTGAGGSIGSEIVRQVARFGAASITLLGRGENSVYLVDREMGRKWPEVERHAVICDVRDRASLRAVFERFRPEVVFHAAAHKHVPLMEANPSQAVLNNVVGTQNVAELAAEFDVDRLVNVSTDKAVNPTNVMGASKRTAEMVVANVAEGCDCRMVSVRFGNVLGSRGSVVPLFRSQIAAGGPVTVTHPDMVRYFMTIPEAAQLVLQAGAFAEPGRVFVLDMGEPVKIVDLARDLILLSGLEPGEDIEITFSGARPGEKLYEELLLDEEGIVPGPHEKIFVARKAAAPADFQDRLVALVGAAVGGTPDEVRGAFQDMVATYRPESAVGTGEGRSTVTVSPAAPAPASLPAAAPEPVASAE